MVILLLYLKKHKLQISKSRSLLGFWFNLRNHATSIAGRVRFHNLVQSSNSSPDPVSPILAPLTLLVFPSHQSLPIPCQAQCWRNMQGGKPRRVWKMMDEAAVKRVVCNIYGDAFNTQPTSTCPPSSLFNFCCKMKHNLGSYSWFEKMTDCHDRQNHWFHQFKNKTRDDDFLQIIGA